LSIDRRCANIILQAAAAEVFRFCEVEELPLEKRIEAAVNNVKKGIGEGV
jgi:hypothetical protein